MAQYRKAISPQGAVATLNVTTISGITLEMQISGDVPMPTGGIQKASHISASRDAIAPYTTNVNDPYSVQFKVENVLTLDLQALVEIFNNNLEFDIIISDSKDINNLTNKVKFNRCTFKEMPAPASLISTTADAFMINLNIDMVSYEYFK